MVIKAGPAGEWHSQPDNGTFELWVQGKNLFPDSGSYVYEGNEEVTRLRNWFRRTASHNTLTLDGKNLEDRVSHTKSWQPEGEVQSLVTEHESYKGLTHRRTFFFIEGSYFVIVDEALGDATGTVNLNWHLCDGKVNIDPEHLTLFVCFRGRCAGQAPVLRTPPYRAEGGRRLVFHRLPPAHRAYFRIAEHPEGIGTFALHHRHLSLPLARRGTEDKGTLRRGVSH